jgi:hypothetical protein
MTRLRIFFWPINLELFVYLGVYQIWCDKTNSLRKSEGRGILWKYTGNYCEEKKYKKSSEFLPEKIKFSKKMNY